MKTHIASFSSYQGALQIPVQAQHLHRYWRKIKEV